MKSPYSVDRTLYPKNETVDRTLYPKNETSQENSNENSTDSKDSNVICAYYDILGEPCPVTDLSSPKPRGEELSFRTRIFDYKINYAKNAIIVIPYSKVSSMQEACAKYFSVHILKFEILQIT